jgi:hypothetical protein
MKKLLALLAIATAFAAERKRPEPETPLERQQHARNAGSIEYKRAQIPRHQAPRYEESSHEAKIVAEHA